MPRVFISYIRENSKEVQRLSNELKAHGVDVWLDIYKIKPGHRWRDDIREAISEGDYFIACFSNEYHERSETYMDDELELAIEELRQRPADRAWFIPVLLSDTSIPNKAIDAGETLRDIQWVDFFKDWDAGVQNILSVIQPDAADAPKIDLPSLKEDDWTFLFHRIKGEKFTPCIGPGFGYGVLPYDVALAREWALEYDYPIDKIPDLANVAQFLVDIFDQQFPKNLIRESYSKISPPDFSESDEPHAVMASLPIPIYITANYDDFLEQALRVNGKDPKSDFFRWSQETHDQSSIFEEDEPFIPSVECPIVFHIYGHIDMPESIVLTEGDYRNFLTSKSLLPLEIRAALARSSVLFLGFNLSGTKFQTMYRVISGLLEINIYNPAIYKRSLNRTMDAEAQAYLKQYLTSQAGGSYYWGTLKTFMADLQKRWEIYSRGE